MSETPEPSSLRTMLSGRWQIPLLGVGLLLFSGGLIRIVAAYQPVTFDDELRRVSTLREVGALRRANAYILDMLREPDRPLEQRGELHLLLARVVYQADLPLNVHTRQNLQSIIRNFQSAVRYGVTPDARDWAALGDAPRWSDDDVEARDAYQRALRLSPSRPDRIHRQLVEMHLGAGRPLTAEIMEDLNAILEDASSSPENTLWALEHRVRWLLEQGDTTAAMTLVEAGKKPLSGTAERVALTYIEALCLCDVGTRYSGQAEALLRSLLDDWRVRDILWGRANWLLGKLQQIDGRPQAALSFYDEAMKVFQAGSLHDACTLGRAECLAVLERYERSLETFAKLQDRFSGERGLWRLDRGAVCTTIAAIGESLLQGGSLELGTEYLRLALLMMDPTDYDAQVYYRSRIAAGLREMARTAAADCGAGANTDVHHGSIAHGESHGLPMARATGGSGTVPKNHERAETLYGQAAEMYQALSELPTLDEDQAAGFLELAADNFDAAGMRDRQIEVLVRQVAEHPTSDRCADALHRLGQAYQAEQRYSEAVAAYEEVIENYPRFLPAHASIVPLAECLLALGGAEAERGVSMLVGIVDDREVEPLFDPQAKEYRQALFRLAEYYSHATEQEVADHFEKAITRLEDAIAFYPDDPRMTSLAFQLADAYRLSGRALRAQDGTSLEKRALAEIAKEADRRLQRAMASFEQVIAALAPFDASALTELDQTYLRASYLNRADCLFDLGRYEDAMEAYSEVAWRYENMPAAVSASMQIVHCHQRLGQVNEARAALERLSWLLRKLPPSAFETERGMSSKQYWEAMVGRLQDTGIY